MTDGRPLLSYEMSRAQPYSMGPASGWDPEVMRISPAQGTNFNIDRPEFLVRTCFVAPAPIQRAARERGINGLIMMRAPGLLRVLGLEEQQIEVP